VYIKQLTVEGVRNLESSQRLEVARHINLLSGQNGAGKTSILEAIYILGRGRSYRGRSIRSVINSGAEVKRCTVFGLLGKESHGKESGISRADLRIGVSRETNGGYRFKVDGEVVTSSSALAEALPLVLINTESFQLLAGGPQNRRRYLDWGLFHTSAAFRDAWRQQQRVLRHRNALLKQGVGSNKHAELDGWDEQFAVLSEQITELRRNYLGAMELIVLKVLDSLSALEGISFYYYQGWDSGKSLKEVLKAGRERDIMLGSSQYGPHRADMRIRFINHKAADILSRGQTKSLVMAMMIAQAMHYRDQTGNTSVFLIDDLPAELDGEHQHKVAQLLVETGCQVFITGTDADQLLAPWQALARGKQDANSGIIAARNIVDGVHCTERSIKLFHVKQGVVSSPG